MSTKHFENCNILTFRFFQKSLKPAGEFFSSALALGLAVHTHSGLVLFSNPGQVTHSVSVHVTGVGPLLPRLLVEAQEVLVARGASHPRLAKPHQAREEELALSGLHPTLRGHLDAASPSPYPHPAGRKDLGLLPVETADLHADRRVLRLSLHLRDAAPSH